MATSLVTPLPTIHPILDPLIATLADSGDPASGRTGQSQVEVQLEIEDTLGADEWRLIGEFLNPYDYTTDNASVTLHKALQGALSASPALIRESVLSEITGIVKRYRLKVRDVIDGEPAGEFATLTPAYAWQAGRRGTAQNTNSLTGKGYLFLTSLPTERRLNPKELLTFQFLALETVAAVELEVTVYRPGMANLVNNYTLDDIAAYRTYAFSTGTPDSYTPLPTRIDIKIVGAFTGTQPTLTYLVTQKPSPYAQQIYLRNSFGGWDSLYCTGKNQKVLAFSSEIFEATEFPITSGQLGNSRSFNQRGNEGYVFRTGFLSEAEQAGVADLLLRNEAWHFFNDALWPMIMTTKSLKEKEDGEYLYAAEITAQYAFDHLAY